MFLWYDYIILIAVLVSSTSIGIYFGCFGSKQATKKEYLSGGKRMKTLPIALSVTIGHFSGIVFIAVPADVYKYGAFFFLILLSLVGIISASIFIFYPVLFKEETSSVYEYLEKRFDRKIRLVGSLLYILYENLLLPVIIYSPSLALSSATGIQVHWISFIICGTCVLYTAIGGLRTVIWTDILQFAIVIVSLAVVCTYGVKSAGGIASVWNTSIQGQRLDIFDFNLDPTKKDSFWICVIGYGVRFLYYFCLSQSSVQKYLSLPSFNDCRKSLVISGFSWAVVSTIAVFLGLIAYANFANCDPVLNHQISKNDEIIPYLVGQIAENVSGISGLFIAMLVSASISTLSSSLNSLSGVIYDDFVCKFLNKNTSERKSIAILKLIVVIEGLLCACLITIIQHLGEIIPLAVGITGMIDGPSLGLLTLAVLFPQTNSSGAFWGTIGGVTFMGVLYILSMYYRYKEKFFYPSRPFSVDGCEVSNHSQTKYSSFNNSTITLNESNQSQLFALLRISYTYYCVIGAIVTIILGLIISYVTKLRKREKQKPIACPLLPKTAKTI